MAKSRENNPFFLLEGKHQIRIMTVINAIPFYCSTGKNSNYSGTWLPHRGIKNGKIVKPSNKEVTNWPRELKELIDSINITNEDFTLKRFGNFYTLCISAQLGGGFWENNAKGKELKTQLELKGYLKTDPALLDHIKLQMDNKNNLQKFQVHEINDVLKKHGVTFPLATSGIFLPTEKPTENVKRKTARAPSFLSTTFMSLPETQQEQGSSVILLKKT